MPGEKMTAETAIDILDKISAQVSLPREGHVRLQEAVQVIRASISNKENPDAT